MRKTQIITLIILVLALILIINFLSWTDSYVVKETDNKNNYLITSLISSISSLIAGILIVGVVAIWVIVFVR
mgnify:CR=1 FL=1